ncbi:MAG: hypothetical protein WCF20_09080 [Methylovirgula sp.]
MSFLGTLLIFGILFTASAAQAAVDVTTPPLGQSVHLIHEAVGCGSLDGLFRIAVIWTENGESAALAKMRDEDCRLFRTFRGEVTDAKAGAICVLGPGNTRCLWFAATAFAPARP